MFGDTISPIKFYPLLCYTQQDLMDDCKMSEKDVTNLIRGGLLVMRDATTMWLGLPNAGLFTKDLEGGRHELLISLRRKKYK